MAVLLDSRNHPLLIHCNKGKVSLPLRPFCKFERKTDLKFRFFFFFFFLSSIVQDV